MPTKQEFTEQVITQLGDTRWDLNSAMLLWWVDNRPDGGMRLTMSGHECFQDADLESWKFDIDPRTPTRPVQLLMLKQHMTMPYYIKTGKQPHLTFYSSREATMFALYGDIDKFVQALRNSG